MGTGMIRIRLTLRLVTLLLLFSAAAWAELGTITLDLSPGPANPRNSEGAFIALRDGRLLLVYTHFTGSASDEGAAHLAGRYSNDGGQTWDAEDTLILANEGGQNTMSVSLLRLHDGRIALFYLRKNSDADCRLYLRYSSDEARTWSEPILCMAELGYFVVNNDRVIQLASGRLVAPAARHSLPGEDFRRWAEALCYLSDDHGATWRPSSTVLEAPLESTSGLQEPGVVELANARLMMLCRTDQGCQMRSWSNDGGNTWSSPELTEIRSPVSPASFKRIPGGDQLLMVWNDHQHLGNRPSSKRTPLTIALSRDGGLTWPNPKNLETDPDGWYCYTAIDFIDAHLLLAYCAGDKQLGGLNRLRIRRIPLAQLLPPTEANPKS